MEAVSLVSDASAGRKFEDLFSGVNTFTMSNSAMTADDRDNIKPYIYLLQPSFNGT